MQHADAHETMERAAVEPQGIERIEAGDTVEAAALAEHLLYCPDCALEWARLRRTATALRATLGPGGRAAATSSPTGAATGITGHPPAELRARTLAYVREHGVARGAATPAEASAIAAATPPAPAGPPEPVSLSTWRRRGLLPRFVGLAAAAVLVVALGGLAYARNQELEQAQKTAAVLAEITEASAKLAGQPDVHSVTLASAASGGSSGALMFSARTGEVVMVARGVAAPAPGQVLSCWVDTGGKHVKLGELTVEQNVGYWWGWVDGGLPNVRPGDTFGVSVAAPDGVQSQPIMTGVLGS